MNRRELAISSAAVALRRGAGFALPSGRINRATLVKRHNPILTKMDSSSPLQVGNGEFVFACGITGLQTFAESYAHGRPLGTQSQWGWHSFPNPHGYRLEDVLSPYDSHGRQVPYPDAHGSIPPTLSSREWRFALRDRDDGGRLGGRAHETRSWPAC